MVAMNARTISDNMPIVNFSMSNERNQQAVQTTSAVSRNFEICEYVGGPPSMLSSFELANEYPKSGRAEISDASVNSKKERPTETPYGMV
jgi:hypothetical protein